MTVTSSSATQAELVTVEQALSVLEGVKKDATGWTAFCPSHNDRKKRSLRVARGDNGELLMHCFAGCPFEEILVAIKDRMGDSQLNRNGSNKPEAEKAKFQFTDAEVSRLCVALEDQWDNGGPVADYLKSRGITREVSRQLRFGATSRTFNDVRNSAALTTPLYEAGKLVGVQFRAVPRKDFLHAPGGRTGVLFGRPHSELADVCCVEGGLDVALLLSHEFPALCIQSASNKPQQETVRLLAAHHTTFIIGDSDRPGQASMNDWQHAVNEENPKAAVRVRIPGYKDVGELYKADPPNFRKNFSAILRRARASREYFELEDLYDEDELLAADPPQPHVVDQLIPSCAITVVYGEEKSGKSVLVRYIGKCVANGVRVFGRYATTKLPVLCMDLENNGEDQANFRDLFAPIGREKIRYQTRKTGVPALNSPALLEFCAKYKPLLMLDNLTLFAGDIDLFHPGETAKFFAPLLNLCAAGATIILNHHTRRDSEEYADSHQIGANCAKMFLVVSEDRPDLKRVRFECRLSRSGEAVKENLVGIPAISETGHFALADRSQPEVKELVDWIKRRTERGEKTMREDVKNRRAEDGGHGAARNLQILAEAAKLGLVVLPKRKGDPIEIVQEHQNGHP
jgi:hypothetical protein